MAPKNLVLLAAAVGPAVGLIPSLSGIGNPVGVASGVVPCSIGSAIDVAAVPGVACQLLLATYYIYISVRIYISLTLMLLRCYPFRCIGPARRQRAGGVRSVLSLPSGVLNSLLSSQCRAVVTTPLVACNVSLAGTNGTLSAPLQLPGSVTAVGSIVGTILGIPVTVISGILALFGGVFSSVPNLG
ncbi:uncharacterized protein LOC101753269 [Setaria italica]|uniref:uncharacterized protein LOC101753269 n=1 Tax=Setaria italica TaxID=4555 RepID=UPI000BE50762|nr:uncharacterized protein LOC101753269 [Setaria italica]